MSWLICLALFLIAVVEGLAIILLRMGNTDLRRWFDEADAERKSLANSLRLKGIYAEELKKILDQIFILGSHLEI